MKSILTAIIFFGYVVSSDLNAQTVAVRLVKGNLFAVFRDSTKKQLTFEGNNESPALARSGSFVVFVRKGKGGKTKSFMNIQVESLAEKSIAALTATVTADPLYGGKRLKNIYSPLFLEDETYMYFLTDETDYLKELCRINIKTGQIEKLCRAESFEEITRGSYKNNFLISEQFVEHCVIHLRFKIVTIQGKLLRSFKSDEETFAFFKSIRS